MDPAALQEHLAQVCADLDAGRTPRRPAFAVSQATFLALMGFAVAGCGEAKELYAAPMDTDTAEGPEVCDNEVDDDGDDAVDCDDPDCEDDPLCATVDAYKAP